jgi:hypothetical protein
MLQAEELTQTIANNWDQIASSLGEQRELFECQLTVLLRQLEATAGAAQKEVVQAILELFKKVPAAHTRLAAALPSKGGRLPTAAVKKERYTIVPVFYGTDRAIIAGESADAGTRSVRLDSH